MLQIVGGNRGDNIIAGLPEQENVLDGRQGDDTLVGGNRADTYAFSAGYGFDRIVERPDSAGLVDRVVFGASVRFEDLLVTRNGDDLLIDLGGGLDVLTIANGLSTHRIERFEFADGRILSIDSIIDRMLTGTAGDDHLVGFDNRNDTLSGGAGSDALEGGRGNDTYTFGIGDGRDSIVDTGGIDRVAFGPGITRDVVQFRNIDGNLLITIGDGADRLAIVSGYRARPVETFVFADGTSLSIEDIRGIIHDGSSNSSQDRVDLRELPAQSTLHPGAGHDRLILSQGSRVVIGSLEGIDSVEMASAVTNATVALESYASTDVVVRAASVNSSDLVISFNSGSQLVVRGALDGGNLPAIEFADGVVWNAAALVQTAIAGQVSGGNDIIVGSVRADALSGGAGDDALSGGAGDDTYRFTRGDGRDVIDDSSGNDTLSIVGYRPDELRVAQIDPARNELVLSFGNSTDQIVLRYNSSWSGVETVRFSDGTAFTLDRLRDLTAALGTSQDDRIVGGARDETFDGRSGDDVILGGGGNDVYRFGRGAGQDRIESDGSTDGQGTLVFGPGIALEDIVATRDADGNIVLSIRGTADRVTLVDPASDIDPVVAEIVFADGRSLGYRALAASIPATGRDDRVIVPGDIANPGIGSTIFGGLGNDRIQGGRGADVISGGKGDDLSEGGDGADTYYFGRGDGQDMIYDIETRDVSKVDKIRFGAGILPSDIRFLSVGPMDLVIGVAGSDDRLTLRDAFRTGTSSSDYGVEQFAFADGTVWQLGDIHARAAGSTGASDDTIDFGPRIDVTATLEGGAGDDMLAGGIGDTTYVFGRGYGHDIIRESATAPGSTDTLRMAAGIAPADVVVIRSGSDLVLRLLGTDDRLTLLGQAGASTPPIDVVRFSDETQWNAAELMARAVTVTAAERVLHFGNGSADPFLDPAFAGRAPGSGEISGSGAAPGASTIGLARFETQTQPVHSLSLVGSATALGDGVYRLTTEKTYQSGAIWGIVDLSKDTVWTTRIFFGSNDYGADGVSFALQNTGPNALVNNSASTGALISGSFGLLFDTWGQTTDFSQFILNGNTNATDFDPRHDFAQIEDAAWHDVVIDWNATTKTFAYFVDGAFISAKTYDVVGNLFGGDTTVWYGFGAATGAAYNDQRVQLISVGPLPKVRVDAVTAGKVEHIGSGLFNRQLAGAAQRNTYDVFVPLSQRGIGIDTISNFYAGDTGDILNIAIAQGLSGTVIARQSGSDTLVYFAEQGTRHFGDARLLLRLSTVAASSLTAVNFAGAGFTVVADQVLDGGNSADLLRGGWGTDTLLGHWGNDRLVGGTGDDALWGGGDDDVYVFNRGDGHDTITDRRDDYDFYNGGNDAIEFGAGISWDNLTFKTDGSNLSITIAGGTDSINIVNGFRKENGLDNGFRNDFYRIEELRFSDGAVKSFAAILDVLTTGTSGDDTLLDDTRASVLIGGAGDDTIFGYWGNDRLVGGRGNDNLFGGSDNDVYVFNRGDGRDTITDRQENYDFYNGGYDAIEFGANINWEDLNFTTDSRDLLIAVAGGPDSINIVNGFRKENGLDNGFRNDFYRIEELRFSNGSVKSFAAILDVLTTGTSGADILLDDTRASVLIGGAGDDTIFGYWGNDRLVGGPGDDNLSGGSDNDVYVFNRGDGRDTITDRREHYDFYNGGYDAIEFGAGILWQDLTFKVSGTNLSISFRNEADHINITKGFGNENYRIEELRFADGSVKSYSAVLDVLTMGTSGDDVLVDDARAAILAGGSGNDRLVGGAGSDTYVYNAGDGEDRIGEGDTPGTDRLLLGVGITAANITVGRSSRDTNHIMLRFDLTDGSIVLEDQLASGRRGVEEIQFADGTLWSRADLLTRLGPALIIGTSAGEILTGSAGDDTFEAGAGNDTLRGYAGSDTYRFGPVLGNDMVMEGAEAGNDRLDLSRQSHADVTLLRIGNDLVVVLDTGETVGIVGQFSAATQTGVEEITFADGIVWNRAQIQMRAEIVGTDGDDALFGSALDDVFQGGRGNDRIESGAGSDTFLYDLGDGSDWLNEESGARAETDVLWFKDLNPSDVVLSRSGIDLLLRITATGSVIEIDEQFRNADFWGVEEIRFADGSRLDRAQIESGSRARGTSATGTDGNDVLLGSALDDVFQGGRGNDQIESGAGSDTFLYGLGDGSDWLNEESGSRAETDVLWFKDLNPGDVVLSRSGIDLLVRITATGSVIEIDEQFRNADFWGVEEIRFADGSRLGRTQIQNGAWLRGTNADNIFSLPSNGVTVDGGRGDDTMTVAGDGANILRFAKGDGHDTIDNLGSGYSRDDTLHLIGILPSELTLSRSGDAMVIRLPATGDTITVKRQFWQDSIQYGISRVLFADGTEWNRTRLALYAHGLPIMNGTDGPDRLLGTTGTEAIYGLSGNDVLDGQGGSDRIHGGEGDDIILVSISDFSNIPTLSGGLGIDTVSFQNFAYAVSTDLAYFDAEALTRDGVDVSIGSWRSVAEIEQVENLIGTAFHDNLFGDASNNVLAGLSGSDGLYGRAGNDTLDGGLGNDTLDGGLGNDTYLFRDGDGSDVIFDQGVGSETDTLQLGPNLLSANIVLSRSLTNIDDLLIRFAGHTGSLLLQRQFVPDDINGIDRIIFGDGQIWSRQDLAQAVFAQGRTEENDRILGSHHADTIHGGSGDDVLSGWRGADVLFGDAGQDILYGQESDDTLVGGEGADTVVGGFGADLYVFAAGDGLDTLTDHGDDATDTLRIKSYHLSDIRFSSRGQDLIVRFSGSADRIIVRNGLGDNVTDRIESFAIEADGINLSLADIRSRLVDDIEVTGRWLVGGDSDDTLAGTDGDDHLKGGAGADILTGNAGDDQFADLSQDAWVDTLTGGGGRDTYYFLPVRDDGAAVVADIVTDFQAGPGGDVIRLSVSNPNPFESGAIRLTQWGGDTLVMRRPTTGPDQALVRLVGVEAATLTAANFDGVSIALDNSISINDDESGHFLDGSALDDRIYGNGGADTIRGFAGNDRLSGGADDDLIEGGLGDDLIAGQQGADRITGGGGSDVMSGGTGDDVIVGFGDGSLPSDVDVFVGGEGDDRLSGGAGTDTYRFARGDGRDTLTDLGGTDRIEFSSGIGSTDVSVSQVGRHIELRIATEGGRIRLADALDGASVIETIGFADGVTWNWNEVLTRSMRGSAGDDTIAIPTAVENGVVVTGNQAGGPLEGQSGNDDLRGGPGADILVGGTGNDVLRGEGGDDTYVFARGDGQDAIFDNTGANTLSFAAGILASDVRAVLGTANLVLEIVGTSDRIDLGPPATLGMGVSRVIFADGTVWTQAALSALSRVGTGDDDIIRGDDLDDVLTGAAGDDLLVGNGGADTLDGGPGHDRLEGGQGEDRYLFSANGGHDRITDTGGNDTLVLATGIAPSDITVAQSRDGVDFALIVKATGARITIENALGAGKIETIRFADGTTWTIADLIARAPSSDDDVLTGDGSANLMIGGLGNDHLSGGAGDDVYRFARGDGADVIDDRSNSTADRLEISGYTGAEISFHRVAADSDDVAIRFAGTTDQIVIVHALGSGSAGIETIALADGTQFSVADMRLAILSALSTDGADIVIGTAGADTLTGGKGSDLLRGGYGEDTYLYRRGDGDDRIDAVGAGPDVVSLTDYTVADIRSAVRAGPDSNDLVVTFSGTGDRLVLLEALSPSNNGGGALSLRFSDGAVWNRDAMRARALSDIDGAGSDNVYGFDGADTFAARPGDDLLSGAEGGDLYLFGRASGNDTIVDAGSYGSDRVTILGLASTDARVEQLYRGSDAISIGFTGNKTDSLTIFDALSTGSKGIETYVFADGVTWTKDTLRQLLGNRAPTALGDGFYSVTTGVELVIKAADILRNDFDADGDALTIVAVDAGDTGVAAVDAQGNVRFHAVDGYYGPASVSYTVSDGRNGFSTASIDLRVRPVATAYPDSGFTVAEDASLVIRVERLLANDLDGDRMIVGQVTGAKNGSVSLSSDGNISFTPSADFNGLAEFTYVANTPEGGRAEAKVVIQVTAVNDAPVGRDDVAEAIAEGASFTLDPRTLLANDTDVDGDRLSVQSVQSNANVAATIGADGLIRLAPRAYFWGAASFDYVVADASGATSTGRVTFTVTPVNDPPELHDDRFETTDSGSPIREDNPIVIGADRLLANDIEHDGETMALTAVRNVQGGGGYARLLENGTVLFTPDTDFNGDASFEYQVDDGHGASVWARATLVYQAVNDLPVARDDSYRDDALPILRGFEDTAIEIPIIEFLKNDYDPEGFSVRFESAGSAVHGDIQVTDRGTIIFTPDADYWGEATFSYLVSDNEGAVDGAKVTLRFENVGDAPPAAVRDVIFANEDIPVVIPIATLLANDTDIDRDPVRFLGWRPATKIEAILFGEDDSDTLNGTVEFDANGNLVFTPNRDATKSSGFIYRITDDADGVVEGYVDITIVPSNDDPTVGEDEGFVTPLDAPLVLRVGDLLKNDYDIEQADHDGDGQIDDDLDNPNRARPAFVGVDGVYDADALALGQRIARGQVEVVEWNAEKFVVVRFAAGFTGNVAVEYRIADRDGATDTGFVMARVADGYGGVLRGTARVDYLAGTPGADLVQALGGNDHILAGAGDDTIEAGAGNDEIDAGAGDDRIDGGDGADRITGGAGFDTVTFQGSDVGVRADLESRVGQGGYAQGDTYLGVEAIIGTQFADQLGGDAASNRLEGRGGNDLLEGRGGADILLGGDDDDILLGGAGADVLDGGAGRDTADYSFGATGVSISLAVGTAHGGDAEGDVLSGIENLTATDADDLLEGDTDANVLSGGRGNDILIGGAGDDILIGGHGADQLIGGQGIDVADYTQSAEGVVVDMANGSAGGGDAMGDTFSGVEIIQGSYQNDTIHGDEGDNRIRGGRGADIVDGRGGFDIADYSRADEGVAVNLTTGRGTAGEATGDQLASIEMIVGSLWADHFIGSVGNDRFQGLRGDDTIAGGAGSDGYVFGFDDGRDVITEQGAASDTDRLILSSEIAPKDVSVIREGDDLLLEFERQDGFLVDSMRVRDHFVGRETGIEEMVFADGTIWTPDRIEALQRLGRLNAADDVVLLAFEDSAVIIDPATLIANDADLSLANLTLAGVGQPVNGSVRIREDGKIEFLGAPNFNGDAFFKYSVRDQYGRESTAQVEVDLAAVNDAPTAIDDPLVYATEDRVLRIRIDSLLANDFDIDGDADLEELRIVSISPLMTEAGAKIAPYNDTDHTYEATNAAANIDGDYIAFKLRPDYFGPAGFVYTLKDASGTTSTARVEISIAPVNDAPRDHDGVRSIRLGRDTVVTVAELMANTYDIEGDNFSFVGLQGGLDGNSGNNGSVVYDAGTGRITITPASLGLASLEYDVIDARGAAATLTFDFSVRPLNDPPKANNDYGLRTLEDQPLVIDPATILANDTDENGDALVVTGLARFADGGKVRLREDGRLEFRPTPDYNGAAGFSYTIGDGRGGVSTAYAAITVLPRNAGPILRNDLVTGLEDGPLFVIPAEAFGNDVEPDGDVLFFKRSTVLGIVDHRFLSADFTADAALADGSALPVWLQFDPVTMRFAGTPPARMDPVSVDVWVSDPANGRVFNTRFALTAQDVASGFDARTKVLSGYEIRSAFTLGYEFDAGDLDARTTVTIALADGSALPSWLSFDARTLRFAGTPPNGMGGPIEARLTFSHPAKAGGEPLSFTDGITLDPTRLPAGIAYDSRIALFDTRQGSASASIAGGRPLPDWLSFDAGSRSVRLSGFEPDADTQLARLHVVFTPARDVLSEGIYASSDRGFTLEFIVDPRGDLTGQVAAINHELEGEAYFADQGLFALDLKGSGPITATRESGAPLPAWLTFDAATLTLSGSPPPAWIGAVPVRLDIAAGNGRPAMSVITEAVVDDTFAVIRLSASAVLSPEQIRLGVPKDFNGTVVLGYDATDEKGGVSAKPALIFYDVEPTRERPDAALDNLAGREGESTRFAIGDLLRNDFDRDRDLLRILSLGAPANGALAIELAHVAIVPPAGLDQQPGAVWTASLASGAALPSWLLVDAATGVLSGEIPLAFAASLDIRFTRTVDGANASLTATQRFDGNAGAYAVYTPTASYSGDDGFTYVVTDGRDGPSTGTAVVHVAALYDPPTTVADEVRGAEDTALVIDPQTLLANDFDVDGNPIRFTGVANAVHGSVSFDGTRILFTPDRNFEGDAAFEYLVTDDTHGSSIGKVKVVVASTNRAPNAATDVFEAVEDAPFEFTTAQLLANDSDLDGDAIVFQALSRSATGGRILELPGGRWTFVPDENVNGPIGFSYTVTDGRKTSTGAVRFDIAAVNDAPIANPDGAGTGNDPQGVFRTLQDRAIAIDFAALVANDRDVEGDGFSVVEIFDADQGSVVRDGSTAVFTPQAGYIGDAGFHYRVTDVHGASSVGYATLLVAPNVPLPIPGSDIGFEILEDGFIDIDPAALIANDYAPVGSTLTFVGIEGGERLANGKYRIAPAADFNGDLVLRYAIKNEQNFAVSTTVTINVLPVADAPVARPDTLAMREDTPITLFASQLLANDSDADKQAFVLNRIVDSSGVTVADFGYGQLRITPDADSNGPAWFDYEIEDSTGLAATARVSIAVSPVNDAPAIATLPVFRGTEDQRFSATLPAAFVTDIDGDAVLVEVRGKGGAGLPAWLQYDAHTRTLSGAPPANFNGVVALEVAASDATAHAIRELLVSIAPVNDAPVIVSPIGDVQIDEDQAFSIPLPTGAFTDADGDALTFTATLGDGSPLPSWMSLADGTLVGTPPRNFSGVLQIALSASDGASTVTARFPFVVRAINDAPVVASAIPDQTLAEDTAGIYTIPAGTFSDLNGDTLSLSAKLSNGSALPTWLSFDAATGTLSARPPGNFNGSLDLTVTASDGARTVSDTFRLTVTPVNDTPVAADDSGFTVTSGAVLSIAASNLLANDTDPDAGATLTVTAVGSAQFGAVSLSGGTAQFTPQAGYSGPASFQYAVSDGSGGAATATVTLTVAPFVTNGTSGNDRLTGGANADLITGGDGNDTLSGLAGDDILDGGLGNDTLDGGPGVDTLRGGAGSDSMSGGAGNDLYVVDIPGDVVTELASEGTDEVRTALGSYTLGANVENLTYTGSGAFAGTGNALDNTITGGAGNDTLSGGAGNDTLIGGAGSDRMNGGAGNDVYIVDGAGHLVREVASEGTDEVRTALASYTLGANVENLTYTGSGTFIGTGNTLVNVITGGAEADTLDGGAGADTLIGGAGNDTLIGGTGSDGMNGGVGDDVYVVDVAGDVVTENANEGADLVRTSLPSYTLGANVENLTYSGSAAFTGTGNALANVITGAVSADTLDGGAGIDTLIGGAGNDIYVIDNPGDLVTEALNQGADLVRTALSAYTLGSNLENLTYTGASTTAFTGTGNELDNTLIGGGAADTLTGNAGDDVLNGGAGADTLGGGLGNDTYFVDNAGDFIGENANEGLDLVQSAVTFTLAANIENLTLTGAAAINGFGNDLANLLTGNAAANTLAGGSGADTLKGGAGNDTYVVDNVGDVVFETASEGTDIVQSSVSWGLAANVENLTLTGSSAINGTGNDLANTIVGNAGANLIDGGLGKDILTGGSGADTFAFTTALNASTNLDQITDFTVAADFIQLKNSIFAGLNTGSGTLAAGEFRAGSAAADADDHILYNASTGALLYDADGKGATASVQFAKLATGLSLTNANFRVA